MMTIVNLYSALSKKTPLLHYVFQCVVKRNVFSADLKKPELSDGSQRWSGKRWRPLDLQRRKPDVQTCCSNVVYVQLMADSRSETLTTGNI